MSKEKFIKPAIPISTQINLLSKRGLIIQDELLAQYYLSYIGYYRLSGYAHFYFENTINSDPSFKPGTTFEQILDLYIFDRELRLHILDAVERIEVAFKTQLSNWMSEKYHPHWYLKQELFIPTFHYKKLIDTIEKETGYKNHKNEGRKSPIFSHYYNKYDDPPYPPSWMLTEGLSLGMWSTMFEYLVDRSDKTAIAKGFNLRHEILQSWMQSLSYLRNICAHHLRLWNRSFHIMPCVPHSLPVASKLPFMKRHVLYPQLAMIHILVDMVSKGNHWSVRLKDLLEKHHSIPLEVMGFSKDWHLDPFWQSKNIN